MFPQDFSIVIAAKLEDWLNLKEGNVVEGRECCGTEKTMSHKDPLQKSKV